MTKPRPGEDGAHAETPSEYIPPPDRPVNPEALHVAVDMALDLEDRLVAARLWELRRDVAAIREAIEDALP